jgi:hypothetical protein
MTSVPRDLTSALLRTFRFLAVLAAACAAAEVPRPQAILGFPPGADYRLAGYGHIAKYFQALDAASDRVRVVEIGRSEGGRPILMALISAAENLAQAEKYRRISERLALGQAAGEAEARALAAEGRAIVWIDSGLHASEVATAQHAPELAYRLATGEDAETTRIRERVILLQIPVINPDGLDMVADWYRNNARGPYERAPLPRLYHKYAGHDNNRDWFMMNLAETRHASRVLYHEWFPQIVYNQHQAPPFPARIFVPPFADPVNPHIPAAVMEGVGLLGAAMRERFARENKPGVLSYRHFDAWWNGGLRSTPAFHNMHGLLTETALHSFASPRIYTRDDIPERFTDGLSAREPSVFYQRPWAGGRWGLREPIEYMLTADMAVLSAAADRAADFLLKSWQLARASIEAGRQGNPYAYALSTEQWDRPTALLMLEKLLLGGVEVQRARAAFTAEGKSYPAGTYVLPAAQPFRPYLLDLMEPQRYPNVQSEAGRPPRRPYDIAGWTLAMQMGVRLERINGPFRADLERVAAVDRLGRVERSGAVVLLDHRQNVSFQAMAEALNSGAEVRWTAVEFQTGGRKHPAGTMVVTGGGAEASQKFGADVLFAGAAPRVPAWRVKTPRVALYQPWTANADAGWTEWLFDTFGVPYTVVRNDDLQRGGLRDRFDTVVLASQAADSILHGLRTGEVRGNERELPAVQRPEYAGGVGIRGVHELDRFVRAGGTLLAFEAATELPVDYFPLPVRNRARSEGFACPGSLLRITVDPRHPLGYGMPAEAIAFSTGTAAYRVTLAEEFNRGDRQVTPVARFAGKDVLASGWVAGEQAIQGQGAVLEARHGEGRVVLIAFRPQFRGQSHGTFKFVLNAVYWASAEWEEGR